MSEATITTSFDPEAGAFSLWLAPRGAGSPRTEEVVLGVMLDFDAADALLGIEVLSVQARGMPVASLPVPVRPAADELLAGCRFLVARRKIGIGEKIRDRDLDADFG